MVFCFQGVPWRKLIAKGWKITFWEMKVFSFNWHAGYKGTVVQKFRMVFDVKWKTHFSFSPITILIWIFWVCQLSPVWYKVDYTQLMSPFVSYQLQLVYLTMEHRPLRNLQHETSQTTFDTFDQSQHLLHTLQQSFLHVSCVFTFLEIIKHDILTMLHIFFHLQY